MTSSNRRSGIIVIRYDEGQRSGQMNTNTDVDAYDGNRRIIGRGQLSLGFRY